MLSNVVDFLSLGGACCGVMCGGGGCYEFYIVCDACSWRVVCEFCQVGVVCW